jgi:heme/copper-type cytochrome/quinol oxidase subunit 2
MRSQNKWIKQYWSKNVGKFEQEEKTNLNIFQEFLQINDNKSIKSGNSSVGSLNNRVSVKLLCEPQSYKHYHYRDSSTGVLLTKNLREQSFYSSDVNNNVLKTNLTEFLNTKSSFSKLSLSQTNDQTLSYNYKTTTIHEESTRDVKNTMGKTTPVKLIKIPVSKIDVLDSDNLFLFKFRYSDKNSTLLSKTNTKIPYFAFKQQRYKARKLIGTSSRTFVDDMGNDKVVKSNFTLNNQYVVESSENPTRYYRMLRKNRVRSENMPVVVSKRLLRVKKTLVLPTHINITAVTNSYDVVHSWFIPGLGLKMDCVPGRSTHHTFYVDNAGFYYGQCAEICGRYHHHMPIRVCALPFEHFLVW